jgi:hypothetical protein
MLIRCIESSILVGCAYNILIGLSCTLLWSLLLFLLSTLQSHRKIIMEISRGFSVTVPISGNWVIKFPIWVSKFRPLPTLLVGELNFFPSNEFVIFIGP